MFSFYWDDVSLKKKQPQQQKLEQKHTKITFTHYFSFFLSHTTGIFYCDNVDSSIVCTPFDHAFTKFCHTNSIISSTSLCCYVQSFCCLSWRKYYRKRDQCNTQARVMMDILSECVWRWIGSFQITTCIIMCMATNSMHARGALLFALIANWNYYYLTYVVPVLRNLTVM